MTDLRPFRIAVPDETLADIAGRVRAFPWHEAPAGGGWAYGADLDYMKALACYWADHYDWRRAEADLNRFPQFQATVADCPLHFYHVRSGKEGSPALLLSHGWPGSVFEFLNLIDPLTTGDPPFDLVIPSLPGYGWSAKPATPIGPRRIAHLFSRLMTETLGYRRYIAQGGDWGSAISTWIGIDDAAHCAGVHLNMFGVRPAAAPETAEEKAWARDAKARFAERGGYFRVQATYPQTLSYAMMDSPVGVAAWIIEKFHTWSDFGDGDFDECFSKDTLLTNVMIYLVTRSFNTASWLYRGFRDEASGVLPTGTRVDVPVGAAVYPKEFIPWPPRSHAEKAYNIVRWTEMPRGGHFAALEQPESLITDIRAFAENCRT